MPAAGQQVRAGRPAARCSSMPCRRCPPNSIPGCDADAGQGARLAIRRGPGHRLHHTRHDARRPQRSTGCALPHALTPSHRRAGAGGSPRGHSGESSQHLVQRLARQLGKTVTACRPTRWRGSRRTRGRATSASFAPCSSARSWSRRARIIEVDEDLLDERTGRRQLSPGLADRLGRHGRGLARQASPARPARGSEADSPRLARQADRAINWSGASSARRRSRPDCDRRTPCSSTTSASTRAAASTTSWSCSNGLDLQHIVTRFGPQPAERVIMLLRQACRSLAEAHEHGLVHRDIKPANLFVARLGAGVRLPEGPRLRHREGSARSRTRRSSRRRICFRARRRSWRRNRSSATTASTAAPISIRWRAAPTSR